MMLCASGPTGAGATRSSTDGDSMMNVWNSNA